MRNITWAKDNERKNWIAYNRMRGQYMSALEHAVPERFFNDPAQCNPTGTATPTPGLPTCPQGISAVKAIAIAAQAGQKIYNITQEVYANNPSIVSTSLSAHSRSTKDYVQQALDAGYEVAIHEAPITQDGWTGAGYTVIDTNTGAGGYLIEGGSNGAWLVFFFTILFALTAILFPMLAGASAMWVTGGYAALNFFVGCLVDNTSNLVFYTSLLTWSAMLMAFALLSQPLFLVAVLVNSVLALVASYGAFSAPNEPRLTCRILGL